MTTVTARTTLNAPTEGQVQKLVQDIRAIFKPEDALKVLTELEIDKDGLQDALGSTGVLQEKLTEVFVGFLKTYSAKLPSGHVVESKYGYFSGYEKARPMDGQIKILQGFDWGRKVDWELNEVQKQLLAAPIPQGSEGYFAVVFDQTMITDHDGLLDSTATNYGIPVTRVLEMLSTQRNGKVVNYRNGELDPEYYRRSKRSSTAMRQLWESQDCPTGVLLIAAQLGITYRGHSIFAARIVIRGKEFPLDAYELLQMVLTHSNRLQNYNDLWIDVPAAEYSPDADGSFEHAMCFGFDDVWLWFNFIHVDETDSPCGSASGVFSQ